MELLSYDRATEKTAFDIFINEVPRLDRKTVHWHNYLELTYIEDGSATHTINRPDGTTESHRLRAGDYFFIECGSSHGYENGINFRHINVMFFPKSISKSCFNENKLSELIIHSPFRTDASGLTGTVTDSRFFDDDGYVGCLLKKALAAYGVKSYRCDDLLRHTVTLVILTTLQKLYTNAGTPGKTKAVREIIDYIDKHYSEHISLTELCGRMYFSVSYISRRFRKECGMTFENYLQQIRCHHACDLLIDTDMPLKEVAYTVGYSDINHFREIFQRLVGKKPSEFRKLYQSRNI